jgi:hypothetical protein
MNVDEHMEVPGECCVSREQGSPAPLLLISWLGVLVLYLDRNCGELRSSSGAGSPGALMPKA